MAVVPAKQLSCGRLKRHSRTMAQSRKTEQLDTPPAQRGRPAALGDVSRTVGGAALARAGFGDPTLVLRWEEIAGAETARLARPLKLGQGPQGGVLTLMAEPGAAVFLQHESRPLCERINAYLGRPAVARLKFVSAPLTPRQRAAPRAKASASVPQADPARTYQGPERLKEALLRLAKARLTPR